MNIEEATQLLQQEFQHNISPLVWSVAGSDNTAGAGIQADNKVFERFGVRAGNIVTAITAQNHTGLLASHIASHTVFDEQWRALAQQEQPAVIKLGMLASEDIVHALIAKLSISDAKVICDPVMKASSGGSLLQGNGKALYHQLLHYVHVLTPNQHEFCELFSVQAHSLDELMEAALDVSRLFSIDLIITGGESLFAVSGQHELIDKAVDVCVIEGESFFLESPLQDTTALHGTGCSFSSAVAASVALGYSVKEAAVLAKAYLNQGLMASAAEQELIALAQDVLTGQSANTYPAFQHTQFPAQMQALPNVIAAYSNEQKLFSAMSKERFPVIDDALGLYPVVDSVEWVQKCLKAGVKTIQLRVKDVEPTVLDNMVAQAAKLGHEYNARLFINDYWQLAIKHKAYGVHLGQEDLEVADMNAIQAAGLHLGLSTHSWFEIARAHSLKPSYIAIGPIYETTTKVMPWQPQGLDNLYEWNHLLSGTYPIVAIGGINADNAEDVLSTGVGSIAMVRAITEADDYVLAINQLNACIASISLSSAEN